MTAVLLTAHVLIVLALIGFVLLQRSEGGALGMGGGGGFMTGRGAANALTRFTSILAALFFSTSLLLAVFADRGEDDQSVLQQLTTGGQAPAETPSPAAPATTDDLLRSLGADEAISGEPESAPAPAPEAAAEDVPAAAEATSEPAAEADATPPAEEPNN